MRLFATATLLLSTIFTVAAQTPPKPKSQLAPGAAPDKVWVNTPTGVYHCPSANWYGRTKEGKYMSEPDALKAGFKPSRGEKCFVRK